MPSSGAGLITAIKTGVSAGLGAFRRYYQDPAQVEGGAVFNQWSYYRTLWAYYDNSAFENIATWSAYKGQYRLYRQMRLLYNPTRRLCDFYATHIYPGLLTADAATVPEETELAVPLPDETAPEVRAALDQLWHWSRWQTNKSVLCRYGAVAGSVLVEVVDAIDEGRVYLSIVWPALVAYLDLDPTGVVWGYALQYVARDDNGISYEYRKEVDASEIRFYKDGQLHDYGEGSSYANPYGVVPAVWIKHKDLGGDTGAPAIHGSLGKIDEVNSLGSHVSDQVHKVIGAPIVLWSEGSVGNLFASKSQTKGAPTSPYDTTDLDREGVLMLKGPQGGKIDHLAGQLQLHEAIEHIQLLLGEIEQDHPEVTMYRQLRAMSQVTGPAAVRLMGDVVSSVDEAAANYDAGCSRLFTLALCIGGWRANRGDWGALSTEQQLFAPFDLAALRPGALALRILPRPLIKMSEAERLELQQLRDSIKAGVPTTLAANLRETIPE